MKFDGLLIKAIDGFYYVVNGDKIVTCHARGILRKNHESPLVGDMVTVDYEPDSVKGGECGTVCGILPRKNSLVRPPVANIDRLVIVMAVADPAPNLLITDRLCAVAQIKNIEPIIVINKCDIGQGGEIAEIYKKAGFDTVCTCGKTGMGVDTLKSMLQGYISAFTGNTGVGKSSLLNHIDPRLGLKTGEISRKLGRGRHTTRHVELYALQDGGYIADTPGFSAVDIEKFEPVLKENLQYAFREFEPFINKCRFTGCAHIKEKGCAVIDAVERGVIPQSRHKNYCMIYDEVKDIKEWELKK